MSLPREGHKSARKDMACINLDLDYKNDLFLLYKKRHDENTTTRIVAVMLSAGSLLNIVRASLKNKLYGTVCT